MSNLSVNPLSSSGTPTAVRVTEILAAAAISIILLMFGLLTIEQFGNITPDEICYSDPAVNLLLNGTFTSSAWYAQPKEEFWACNPPLHQFLLFLWLKIWGFSMGSVRGFGTVAICLAGFLYWLFLRRGGWIRSPSIGYCFLVAFLCGYGMSLWTRLGRPDSTCILLGALFCHAWGAKHAKVWLLLLGAMAVGVGIHMAAWICALAVSLFIVSPKRTFLNLICVGAGLGLGTLGLLALYWSQGVLGSFAVAILPHTAFDWMKIEGLRELPKLDWPSRRFFGIASGDYSIWILMLFFAFFSFVSFRAGEQRALRLTAWTVLTLATTCVIFYVLGVTPPYYSWMLFLPLVGATFALASSACEAREKPLWKTSILALAILACIASSFGIPRRVIKVLAFGPLVSQAELAARIAPILGTPRVLFADSKAYYAVKRTGRVVFTGSYPAIMTDDEKLTCEAAIVPQAAIPPWVLERIKQGTFIQEGTFQDNPRREVAGWVARLAGTPEQNMERVNFVIFKKP